jgi:hypothetical protein
VPQPGYRFAGWRGIEDRSPAVRLVPATTPISLTATFKVDGEPNLLAPKATALHGNEPNPFQVTTSIRISVSADGSGRLDINNSRGQWVRSLGNFPTGYHCLNWDGADLAGRRCASGVHFARLRGRRGR